jgi:hypothetical protein
MCVEEFLEDWSSLATGTSKWVEDMTTEDKMSEIKQKLSDVPHFSWIFFGGTGTESKLHVDDHSTHGWLIQLRGNAFYFVFDHSRTQLSERKQVVSVLVSKDVSIQVRVLLIVMYTHMIHFRNYKPLEVIVNEGEMLFVPFGWAHHVKSLSTSLSVQVQHSVSPVLIHYNSGDTFVTNVQIFSANKIQNEINLTNSNAPICIGVIWMLLCNV